MKCSEITQICGGETTAVFIVQLCRKLFDNLLAVFCSFISALDLLYDFPTNKLLPYCC
jgi:hypothetical protein